MAILTRFATALAFVGIAAFAAVLLTPAAAFSVSPQTTDAASVALSQPTQDYGGCPTPPEVVCGLLHSHAVGLVATGYCVYGQCFEMSYGERVRVVAADGLGPFPKTWFVWPDKHSTDQLTNTYPGDQCSLTIQRNKTRVDIPDSNPIPRCKAELKVGPYLYHEHFASNPASGCLAWLECRETIVP
jgi:hypothetical protein